MVDSSAQRDKRRQVRFLVVLDLNRISLGTKMVCFEIRQQHQSNGLIFCLFFLVNAASWCPQFRDFGQKFSLPQLLTYKINI